jgi:hypothetical protein
MAIYGNITTGAMPAAQGIRHMNEMGLYTVTEVLAV